MEVNCILYNGHIGNAGYGLDYNPETRKTVLAHRLAFKNKYGYYPKIVMHTCNNKQCVNPEHLKAGTQSENVKQSYIDGLQINPLRKLNKEQVQFIFSSNLSQRKLADLYNVSQKVINMIKNKKSYTEYTQ